MSSRPIQTLWAHHHPPGGRYPLGVVPVPAPIEGRAFFPGGYGLLGVAPGQPLPAMPVGGVMILGHDFHSEAGYLESFAAGGERETMPTWKNLLPLLREVPISLERCFFTNLYMGLRQGTETTGVFPGASDAAFVQHCQQFFLEQIKLQRPSLIVTLGMYVPPLLAAVAFDLTDWGTGRSITIKHLDRVGPIRRNVHFAGLPEFAPTVIALLHPSLRFGSLRHRHYRDRTGASAELLLLQDGMAAAK